MKDRKSEDKSSFSRRSFFKTAGIGTAAIAGMPLMINACNPKTTNPFAYKKFFTEGDVVLFQGDSITDAGRDRTNEWANIGRSFGTGYAMLIASKLLGDLADKELTIYNRGISGNKVYQLADRWQKDCIELRPTVLSILIGVNDYWHTRDGNYDGTPEIYKNDFRALMKRTRAEFPDIKLIICEPYILKDTRAVDESWEEPFSHYQDIAAEICSEFDAVWVPFQKAFTDALQIAPATYWTADGVHPSMAGAQLMADTWLNALG